MSYGNGEFIDALKQQSNYLVDISDNLRMFFLQFSDLANYLSELCTNLNAFASATKNIFGDNNVNSAYTKLQNSITKVTNCLKNSSSKTDTYIGIDEEERYGMLTERSTKKGLPSGTKLPLHDLASAKDEVKRTKWNYLYSLSKRSQSLSDKLQETKLVSL
jgi:ABC-type transporter Mla subunit MlaD